MNYIKSFYQTLLFTLTICFLLNSCGGDESAAIGCTNPIASNYDSNADVDDGSCVFIGCSDPSALNYDEIVSSDDGSCVYCSNIAEGVWDINPACPNYTIPVLGLELDLNERFDESISVICNTSNQVKIYFGSEQTVFSNLDEFGMLDISSQSFEADFSEEGYGFININVSGNGEIDSPNSGLINLTYSFVLPFSTDTTSLICPLYLTR